MSDKFKDFPLCINCKYFMEEKTGPLQIVRNCGLTMINPVTGEFEPRGHRQAFAYRKADNPCGPSGLFFKAKDGKKTQPKKKPVVVEEPKESTAKVIEVEVPGLVIPQKVKDMVAAAAKEDTKAAQAEYNKEQELLPTEEPKKRRRRSK